MFEEQATRTTAVTAPVIKASNFLTRPLLSYEVLELPADPGLTLIAFSAAAGSSDNDALQLLASWAATHDPADALAAPQPGASRHH